MPDYSDNKNYRFSCRFVQDLKPPLSQTKPQPQPQPSPNTFTDPRDGQTYRTVELNGLRWMAQNLNFDVGEGCWFYENDAKNGERYGRLYTWEAAEKACPPGWRLPTDEEWRNLAEVFGGYRDWSAKNDIGDPQKAYQALLNDGSLGFSALFGGWRFPRGSFSKLGDLGVYWSATEHRERFARFFYFNRKYEALHRSGDDKLLGLSCRCLQATPSNGKD